GALLLFPKQIVGSWVIGHSFDDEYVGRNMPALVSSNIVKQQVTGDVHVSIGSEKGLKHLDQGKHDIAMPVGFVHGATVRGGIGSFLDHGCHRSPPSWPAFFGGREFA